MHAARAPQRVRLCGARSVAYDEPRPRYAAAAETRAQRAPARAFARYPNQRAMPRMPYVVVNIIRQRWRSRSARSRRFESGENPADDVMANGKA